MEHAVGSSPDVLDFLEHALLMRFYLLFGIFRVHFSQHCGHVQSVRTVGHSGAFISKTLIGLSFETPRETFKASRLEIKRQIRFS